MGYKSVVPYIFFWFVFGFWVTSGGAQAVFVLRDHSWGLADHMQCQALNRN